MRPSKRTAPHLSESLHQHLNMYALGATAAGVSLLALAPPCEAKIVYTPANIQITPGEPLSLDLNHDGIPDFGVCIRDVAYSCSGPAPRPLCGAGHSSLLALPAKAESQQNQIYATSRGWAAALHAGFRISPKRQFSPGARPMRTYSSCTHESHGPWANVTHRYLGLEFIIKGKVHYGWARLNNPRGSWPTLTGYAYETIPNKGITMGKTKGPDDAVGQASPVSHSTAAAKPASLGMLALGTEGMMLWRRKEEAEVAE